MQEIIHNLPEVPVLPAIQEVSEIHKTELMIELEDRIGVELTDYLTGKYWGEYGTIHTIAEHLNVGEYCVGNWMNILGIERRDRSTATTHTYRSPETRERLQEGISRTGKDVHLIVDPLQIVKNSIENGFFDGIPQHWQRILKLRYSGSGESLSDVAKIIGCSKQNISYIEQRALRFLDSKNNIIQENQTTNS